MELFDVGTIVNTHGIKGEVRVLSITDFPNERFAPGASLFLVKEGKAPVPVTVKTHRKHKSFDLVLFEEYDSINTAEPMVGSIVKVSAEAMEELPEDEFYYHEVIGLKAIDEQENLLGHVKEILSPGANDVWVVEREKKKDLLLPYIDEVILEVDIERGFVRVHVLEGLDDA